MKFQHIRSKSAFDSFRLSWSICCMVHVHSNVEESIDMFCGCFFSVESVIKSIGKQFIVDHRFRYTNRINQNKFQNYSSNKANIIGQHNRKLLTDWFIRFEICEISQLVTNTQNWALSTHNANMQKDYAKTIVLYEFYQILWSVKWISTYWSIFFQGFSFNGWTMSTLNTQSLKIEMNYWCGLTRKRFKQRKREWEQDRQTDWNPKIT